DVAGRIGDSAPGSSAGAAVTGPGILHGAQAELGRGAEHQLVGRQPGRGTGVKNQRQPGRRTRRPDLDRPAVAELDEESLETFAGRHLQLHSWPAAQPVVSDSEPNGR